MNIAKTIKDFLKIKENIKGSVGFVPTMGALHNGHLSLIKKAKDENDFVIVSIYVNPTQFLEGEDLDEYPRKEKQDILICERAGVDVVFMPDLMYGDDEVTIKAPNIRGYILDGYTRPDHFNGVLTIVMKLLNISGANKAYFGKKDVQQLTLINAMVKEYYMPIEIVAVDTIRDYDGLALSSRNAYLTNDERQKALNISKALNIASREVTQGVLDIDKIINLMEQQLFGIEIEYIKIVDKEFKYLNEIKINNTIILVAVKIGKTHLIDNIWL